jgi:hypothetical protein
VNRRASCAVLVALATAIVSCRDEAIVTPPRPVEPPVSSHSAIPDAPVVGTIRGAPFVLRDARFIVDRRLGYAHTDIKLSSAKAESPCGPIAQGTATSVWLRLDGPDTIVSQDMKLEPGKPGLWSVHYQSWDGDQWAGVGEAAALVTIHEPTPDGRVTGAIAVCFSDEGKSCVSGSFDAQSCPASIDEPVRGTLPPEAVPEKYRLRMSSHAAPIGSSPPPAPSASALRK